MRIKITLLIIFLLFLNSFFIYSAPTVPGGVTSRIKKINNYIDKTSEKVKSGAKNFNDFDRAKEELSTIKTSYPDFISHPLVIEAEKRITDMENTIKNKTAEQEKQVLQSKQNEQANEKIYLDWANKLSLFKPNTDPQSKGFFGISSEDIETLLTNKQFYEEAKTLYAEFLLSGIDKNSHHELKQADYDINVSILNYEESINRIPKLADELLEQTITWMNDLKTKDKKMTIEKSLMTRLNLLIENSNKLFPDSDVTKNLNNRKSILDKMNEEADKTILENRKMKPDIYKGKDTKTLKDLAKSIVLKEYNSIDIITINITSEDWIRESVIEWTDTTKTALSHRITDGLYCQVSAKLNDEFYVFTLFLNQDEISGKKNPLKGHIIFKDRILEKNAKN